MSLREYMAVSILRHFTVIFRLTPTAWRADAVTRAFPERVHQPLTLLQRNERQRALF